MATERPPLKLVGVDSPADKRPPLKLIDYEPVSSDSPVINTEEKPIQNDEVLTGGKYDLSQIYPTGNNPIQNTPEQSMIEVNAKLKEQFKPDVIKKTDQKLAEVNNSIVNISNDWNASKKALQDNISTLNNLQNQLNDPTIPEDVKLQLNDTYKKAYQDAKTTEAVVNQNKTKAIELQKAKSTLNKVYDVQEKLDMDTNDDALKATGNFLSHVYNALPETVSGTGSFIKSVGDVANENNPGAQFLYDVIGNGIKSMGNDMKTQTDAKYDDKHYITSTAGDIVGSIAVAAIPGSMAAKSGKALQMISGATTTTMQMADGIHNKAKEAGLSDKDAGIMTLSIAPISGLLEVWGASNIIDNVAGKKALNELIDYSVKNLAGKEVTQEAIFNTVGEGFKEIGKKYGLSTLKSAGEEGLTEGLQGEIEAAGENIYDKATGKESYGTKFFSKETQLDVAKQAAIGAAAGSVFGLISGVSSPTSVYEKAKQLESNPEELSKFQDRINTEVEAGHISSEQADNVLRNINSVIKTDKKIPPSITDIDKRVEAINLISKREELQSENDKLSEEIKGYDKAFSSPQQEKISANEESINKINSDLKLIATNSEREEIKRREFKQKEVVSNVEPVKADTKEPVQEVKSEIPINKEPVAKEKPIEEIKPEEVNNKNIDSENILEDFKSKSDSDIEKRMAEIEDSNPRFDSPEIKEFNVLEKEMEKRERESVFNVPFNKASEAIDNLIKKEKEKPNGYGAFIEKRDSRESKEVIERYSNPKELSNSDVLKDFSEGLRGNPTTWYADGLKVRESVKEANKRGIDTKTLIDKVKSIYTKDGYDETTASNVVGGMIENILKGATTEQVKPLQKNIESTISEPLTEDEKHEMVRLEFKKDNKAISAKDYIRLEELQSKNTEYENRQNEENKSDTENSAVSGEQKEKRIRVGNTTPKEKRKLSDKAQKALSVESNTAYDAALKYFIGKGQLHPSAIEQLYGGPGKELAVGKEKQSRLNILNNNGKSIEQIAHHLWESRQEGDNRFDTQDYRNAVEEVINEHNSTGSMMDHLLEKEGAHGMSKEDEEYYTNLDKESHDFIDEARDIWDELSDEDKEYLANEADANVEQVVVKKTKPELESIAKELKSKMTSAENKYQSAKKALEKHGEQDQVDIFGKTEAEKTLFKHDLSEERKTVDELKKESVKAKSDYENAKDKVDNYIEPNQLSITEQGAELANKVRESGNYFNDKATSSIPGLNLAWKAAHEAVALAIENGAITIDAINSAIEKAVKAFKESDYIKNLSDKNKSDWEADLRESLNKQKKEATKPSGIKKALVPEDITTDMEKLSSEEILDMGKKLVEDKEVNPEKIITDVVNGSKLVLEPKEVSALIYHKAVLDKSLKDAYADKINAIEKGESTKHFDDKIVQIESDIYNYNIMSLITARQQSLAFNLRKGLRDSNTFDVIKEISEFKSKNNGTIPAEVEKRFMEIAKELEDLKAKMDKMEQEKESAEANESMNNILEDVERSKTRKSKDVRIKEKTTKLSALVRKGKVTRPDVFSASTGSIVWDNALEIIAKTIDAGGSIAQSVYDAGKSIKNSEWYKSLNKNQQNRADKSFDEYVNETVDFNSYKPTMDNGKLVIPSKLIRDYVKSGIKDIETLTDTIHSQIKDEFPDVTKRQVRDAITGYGKTVNKSKADLTVDILRLKRLGKLLSQKEDLEKGEVPINVKTGIKKLSVYERELKEDIRKLQDDLGITDSRKVNSAISLIEKNIASIEQNIADQNLEIKQKGGVKETPELTKAKEKLKEAREKLKNERYKAGITEENTKNAATKRVQKMISEREEMLKTGNFSTKKKSEFNLENTPLNKLKAKSEKLKDEIREVQYRNELKNRTVPEILKQDTFKIIGGLLRSAVAGIDLGAIGVQGSLLLKNPKLLFETFIRSLKAAGSTKMADEYLNNIKSQDWYPVLKASKLALLEESYRVKVKEEQPGGNIIGMLWNLPPKTIEKIFGPNTVSTIWKNANIYTAAQRAYDTAVNHMRVQVFMKLANQLEHDGVNLKTDKKKLEALGEYVNVKTGRASLGKYEPSGEILGSLFFSARRQVAAFKILNPLYYINMPKDVRKRAIIDSITSIGTVATLAILGQAAVGDDDWDEFFDSNSSNFMSIKVPGEDGSFTTINLTGALKSYVNLLSRIKTGEYRDSSTGKITKLGERYGKDINTRKDAIINYLENKLAPLPSTALKLADQTKNNELDYGDLAKDTFLPMWASDIDEVFKDHPQLAADLFTALNLLGFGMQHYKSDTRKKELKIDREVKKLEHKYDDMQ